MKYLKVNLASGIICLVATPLDLRAVKSANEKLTTRLVIAMQANPKTHHATFGQGN